MKEKIVQGRIEKTLRSFCLLDQPFIKNQDITIEELIKEKVALLGESIKVPRFTRYFLGQYN
jgi:elongation factor Ts